MVASCTPVVWRLIAGGLHGSGPCDTACDRSRWYSGGNFVNSFRNWMMVVCLTQAVLCADKPPDTPEGQKRRTVGVALAGGAALGLAHIGVLEWMEEHRIPIDYIAGTSMGGLVGGLYASGLTTAEIREFAGRVDWPQTF